MEQKEFLKLVVAKKRTYNTTVNSKLLDLANATIKKDNKTKNMAQLFTRCLLDYLVEQDVLSDAEKQMFLENAK